MNEKVVMRVYQKQRKFYNFAMRNIKTEWGNKLAIKDDLIYGLKYLTPLNYE